MLKSRSSNLLLSGAITFAVAAFVFAHDFLWCTEEGDTISDSVASAKARGVWVASLQVSLSELSLPDRTIHIESAWVEHCSRQSERFLTPREQRLDGLHLCFTVAGDRVPRDYFFVPGDEGVGVGEHSGYQRPTVYAADLDRSEAAQDIRLSLLASWHDPRPKNIRFLPQP